MNHRLKIQILDSPHRDHLSAEPTSDVELIVPLIMESDEAVIELDSIKVLEPKKSQPEVHTA